MEFDLKKLPPAMLEEIEAAIPGTEAAKKRQQKELNEIISFLLANPDLAAALFGINTWNKFERAANDDEHSKADTKQQMTLDQLNPTQLKQQPQATKQLSPQAQLAVFNLIVSKHQAQATQALAAIGVQPRAIQAQFQAQPGPAGINNYGIDNNPLLPEAAIIDCDNSKAQRRINAQETMDQPAFNDNFAEDTRCALQRPDFTAAPNNAKLLILEALFNLRLGLVATTHNVANVVLIDNQLPLMIQTCQEMARPACTTVFSTHVANAQRNDVFFTACTKLKQDKANTPGCSEVLQLLEQIANARNPAAPQASSTPRLTLRKT